MKILKSTVIALLLYNVFTFASAEKSEVFNGLSTTSQNSYTIADSVAVGDQFMTDRTYYIQSLPAELANAELIKTANDDSDLTTLNLIDVEIAFSSTIYIAYDSRSTSRPDWMSGFTATGTEIDTSDVAFDLYKRDVSPGILMLGANKAAGFSGARSNYFVLGVSKTTVGSGIFNLINVDDGGYIDANPSNRLTLGSGDGSDKRWEVIYVGNGQYLLECQSSSRRYLTDNQSTPEWDDYNTTVDDYDRWIFIREGSDYKIKNVGSGRYLRVEDDSLIMSSDDDGEEANRDLNCATGNCSGVPNTGTYGEFSITNEGGNNSIDANPNNSLSLSPYNGGSDKRWEVIHTGNGHYLLESKFSSRRYITEQNDVVQWDEYGSPFDNYDLWELVPSGVNYNLRNLGSSKYLKRSGDDLVMSTNSNGDNAVWILDCTTNDCSDAGSENTFNELWTYLSGPEEENGDNIQIIENEGGNVLVETEDARGHIARQFTPVSLPAEITFNWRSTFDEDSSERADGPLRGTGDFRISLVGNPSGELQEALTEDNLGEFEGVQFRIHPHLDESEASETTIRSDGSEESHTATSIWVRYTDPDRRTGDDGAPHTGLQSDACQNRNKEDNRHNCGWDRHIKTGGGFDMDQNESVEVTIFVSDDLVYIEANGREFSIDPLEIRFDQLSAIVVGITNTSRGYESFEITNLQATSLAE